MTSEKRHNLMLTLPACTLAAKAVNSVISVSFGMLREAEGENVSFTEMCVEDETNKSRLHRNSDIVGATRP